MSYIRLNEFDEVVISEDALAEPIIKFVYDKDNDNDKKTFNDLCKYIYWAYNPKGMYSNLLPTQRKTQMAAKYFPKNTWEDIEAKPGVKQMIKLYIDTVYTPSEQLYEHCKKDIEVERTRLAEIPQTKKILFEDNVEIEVEYKGKPKKVVVHVKQYIEVDNSHEKEKAYKKILSLFSYEDKMRSIVEKERIEQMLKFEVRQFDKKEQVE